MRKFLRKCAKFIHLLRLIKIQYIYKENNEYSYFHLFLRQENMIVIGVFLEPVGAVTLQGPILPLL